jgi:hypothetical protein
LVIHNNLTNRMALRRRWFIQISALSTFDGRVVVRLSIFLTLVFCLLSDIYANKFFLGLPWF